MLYFIINLLGLIAGSVGGLILSFRFRKKIAFDSNMTTSFDLSKTAWFEFGYPTAKSLHLLPSTSILSLLSE